MPRACWWFFPLDVGQPGVLRSVLVEGTTRTAARRSLKRLKFRNGRVLGPGAPVAPSSVTEFTKQELLSQNETVRLYSLTTGRRAERRNAKEIAMSNESSEQLITMAEAAKRLGGKIDRSSVYARCKHRKVTLTKVDGVLHMNADDLPKIKKTRRAVRQSGESKAKSSRRGKRDAEGARSGFQLHLGTLSSQELGVLRKAVAIIRTRAESSRLPGWRDMSDNKIWKEMLFDAARSYLEEDDE